MPAPLVAHSSPAAAPSALATADRLLELSLGVFTPPPDPAERALREQSVRLPPSALGDRRFLRRFVARIDQEDPDGCWPWRGSLWNAGYGRLTGRYQGAAFDLRAHRVAYALAVGAVPVEYGVLHRCDNPPCCNPAHLFVGTQAANIADMGAKGRRARGIKIPADDRELVRVMVASMRRNGKSRPRAKALAANAFECRTGLIDRIVQGRLP